MHNVATLNVYATATREKKVVDKKRKIRITADFFLFGSDRVRLKANGM
jgi:hypothetical protein